MLDLIVGALLIALLALLLYNLFRGMTAKGGGDMGYRAVISWAAFAGMLVVTSIASLFGWKP
ncbi:hypothetical protein [Acidovorax sp. SDU_ACID1]|uniref:hypothetical protein n=1 Tax=Acidovorax sp. SDU_ACID1 TaxID=3136632 RepID=UPI0038734513